MNRKVRVVKVGGSLFDFPELPAALDNWLARQPESAHVLLAGGGDLADTIRAASVRFHLDPASAHWICIDLLAASARMLAALLPSAELLATYAELQSALQRPQPRVLVFAVADFLRRIEPGLTGPKLPQTWSVTSDSIAARLAAALGACELVLLKSRDARLGLTARDAAEAGLVDEFFPVAAGRLAAVRWVNLRSAGVGEQLLDVPRAVGPPAQSVLPHRPENPLPLVAGHREKVHDL